jgi:hypothetical protein
MPLTLADPPPIEELDHIIVTANRSVAYSGYDPNKAWILLTYINGTGWAMWGSEPNEQVARKTAFERTRRTGYRYAVIAYSEIVARDRALRTQAKQRSAR